MRAMRRFLLIVILDALGVCFAADRALADGRVSLGEGIGRIVT